MAPRYIGRTFRSNVIVNLKAITFLVAGFAGATSYDQFDRTLNYAPVDAVVSSVAEVCRFVRREGPIASTLPADDCAAALAADEAGAHRGYRLEREFEIGFRYISPVDNSEHAGTTSLAAQPDARAPQIGEQIRVRASKWRPDRTRRI